MGILASEDCHNKNPKLDDLKKNYYLTVLEAEVGNSGVIRLDPSGGSKGEAISCLPLSFWTMLQPSVTLACGYATPLSASAITWLPLCLFYALFL